MPGITLAQASTIVDVSLKKARKSNFQPMTVAVLDAGGHLVAFKREDQSGILRYDIAYGKAWGALGMGFRLAHLGGARGRDAAVSHHAGGGERQAVIAESGRRPAYRDASGDVIGAVGLSGDTGDNDEIAGIAGIEAAGLKADPGGAK